MLHVIVGLVLVFFPLGASSPEPVLHCIDGGGRPVEEHGARDIARSIVNLALVCLPLVASAPEPILPSMNDGGRPDAEPKATDMYFTSCR